MIARPLTLVPLTLGGAVQSGLHGIRARNSSDELVKDLAGGTRLGGMEVELSVPEMHLGGMEVELGPEMLVPEMLPFIKTRLPRTGGGKGSALNPP
jgi:hypothetical protein